jgi:hexosaminidase
MKYLISLSIAFIIASTSIFSGNMNYSIIPEPVKIKSLDGSFSLNRETVLVYGSDEDLNSVNFLKKYLLDYYGIELAVEKASARTAKSNFIKFVLSKRLAKQVEGYYTANVGKKGVILTAGTPQGLFYAAQTLIQLLPVKSAYTSVKKAKEAAAQRGELFQTSPPFSAELPVPFVEITDYPRFEYRGMHLDVVRHIYSVDYVKRYIDYLALHKMNYFHWHLTDDQGWRIESKKYPLLNSIGSWRDGTIIGIFPGTGVDSTRYGGFYTFEQIRDIVDYAAKRYITVVPEIDVPGHSMAIIASYPQFSTTPNIPKKPAITWGIFNRQNNVLAPSEEVFKFLEDVFNELMDIFPSKYIHIGADECSKRWWNRSPAVQEYIAKNNLVDGNGLQKYFAQRIASVIKARGREFVGWDEMLEDGLVEGAVVMSWRDVKHGLDAAAQGHKAIMTPISFHYFNVAQRENEDTLCHKQWVLPVKKVYSFEPVPDSIPASVAKYVIGGQGCMWTEYFPNRYRLEWGIFPRMTAVSEIYWSPKSKKNWDNFSKKLIDQFDRYDLWGVNYCNEFFESEGLSRK